MSSYERLLAPGSTELPECRCGKEMQLTRIEELPDRTDAQIRIYNCPAPTLRFSLIDTQVARVAVRLDQLVAASRRRV